MRKHYWVYILAALLAALAVLAGCWQQAHAQSPGGYDCAVQILAGGAFDAHCEPGATWTPEPTTSSTAMPTGTPTGAASPTSSASPTPLPPTATATLTPVVVLPTWTATATPRPTNTPAPANGLRVNVPLLDVQAGDPQLDANNRAILWAGKMSPSGGYTQVRLVGRADGLSVYAQQMTLTGGQFALSVNGRNYAVGAKSAPGWTLANRCSGDVCRGWNALRVIPWSELGGRPNEGDEWPLSLTAPNGEWRGTLHWGYPDYAGRAVAGAQVVTVGLAADASLGGGTDCAADDDPNNGRVPSFFSEWGSNNVGGYGNGVVSLGVIPYANVQAQWDVADWPCYARYIARWGVPLPEGAQVVSATLSLYKFGHSGYAGEPTGVNVMQVWELPPDWTETAVAWDTMPQPRENISRTPVGECAAANCAPGEWHAFDVTEIVRRAAARGTDASALLYTAAGQYHSGRYFYTREGSVRPTVRIAYTTGEEPTWEPTPTAAATSTLQPPTATPSPTLLAATVTATPTPPTAAPTNTPTATATPTGNSAACTRTVSPGGLAAAVAALRPGDVLCLADGTYTEAIAPRTNGTAAAPITIRALHDGKATIDGQGTRKPLNLGDGTGGGNWIVVEGLVLRNGPEHVAIIKGSNNTLRRVSVYDANTNVNSQPLLLWGTGNTVEDCLVGGTGRFMIDIYGGGNWGSAGGNTVRRCFVKWSGWDGKNFCGVTWVNGYGLGVYNASGSLLENNIVYGRLVTNLIVQANATDASANNNQVLGNMSFLAGKDYDGSIWHYGSPTWPRLTRPGPTNNPYGANCDDHVTDFTWPGQRIGLQLFGQGQIQSNTFRDNLAAGNAALGFGVQIPSGPGATGTVIDRLTLLDNGVDSPSADGGKGSQIRLGKGVTQAQITNLCISPAPAGHTPGEAARLNTRYIDGVLTDEPLWPWPMQDRAMAELGVDVTAIARKYIQQAEAACR